MCRRYETQKIVKEHASQQAEYIRGAQARIDGEPFDHLRPLAWHDGWLDMDEDLKSHPDYSYVALRAS